MKTGILLLSRMKQYFLKNKLLWILFLLGGALNAISVTYCYGNLLPAVRNRNTADYIYRDYTVLFQNKRADIADILRLEESQLVEVCIYANENYVFTYDDRFPGRCLGGTLELTQPNQALVSNPANAAVGSKIYLEGQPFDVVGLVSNGYGGCTFISKDAFEGLGYTDSIACLRVIATQRQEQGNDNVIALINDIFPYHTGVSGRFEALTATEADLSSQFIVLISINACLAIASFAFLLRYLIDSLMKDTAVCIILGATSTKMGAIILWESLLLSLAATGIGLGLHCLLYEPVFAKLNLSDTLVYRAGDYWFILLLFSVFSIITAIPSVWKYLRLSPIAARRAAER